MKRALHGVDIVKHHGERLTANYITILIAAAELDGNYDAMVRCLRLPLGTVRSRLHRARGELERLIQVEQAKGSVDA